MTTTSRTTSTDRSVTAPSDRPRRIYPDGPPEWVAEVVPGDPVADVTGLTPTTLQLLRFLAGQGEPPHVRMYRYRALCARGFIEWNGQPGCFTATALGRQALDHLDASTANQATTEPHTVNG